MSIEGEEIVGTKTRREGVWVYKFLALGIRITTRKDD